MNRWRAAPPALSVAAGCAVALAVLAVLAVHGRGAPVLADQQLQEWSVGHRPAPAVAVARAVTYTGSGVIPYALAAAAGVFARRGATVRQRVVAAVITLGCLVGGQAVRYEVMDLAARPRPPVGQWATHASGWSFPSGHTTTAALTAGLLIGAVLVRGSRCGNALVLLIGSWGALVGISRVYLGVHWSTDVLGGWLFSMFWLCLCAGLLARYGPAMGCRTSHRHFQPSGFS